MFVLGGGKGRYVAGEKNPAEIAVGRRLNPRFVCRCFSHEFHHVVPSPAISMGFSLPCMASVLGPYFDIFTFFLSFLLLLLVLHHHHDQPLARGCVDLLQVGCNRWAFLAPDCA